MEMSTRGSSREVVLGPFKAPPFCGLDWRETPMSPKEEDFIRFYRDAVIAGHNEPAAETMRHFNLSRDYVVRLLNETIAGCEGQDIRNWKSGER
jgi:hypothetical protein